MSLTESQVKMLGTLQCPRTLNDALIIEIRDGLEKIGEKPEEGMQAIFGVHERQLPTPDFLKSSKLKTSSPG